MLFTTGAVGTVTAAVGAVTTEGAGTGCVMLYVCGTCGATCIEVSLK